MAQDNEKHCIAGVKSILKTQIDYDILYQSGEFGKLSILNNHVFRYYISPTGIFEEYPPPQNKDDNAKINVKRVSDYDKTPFANSVLQVTDEFFVIETNEINIIFNKSKATAAVYDKRTKKTVLEEFQPVTYNDTNTTQMLKQNPDEYFFGGGMQNGRFTHKGNVIDIVNANKFEDNGVSSPCPFYWSSFGYGVLRNTWQQGKYDFGTKNKDRIETSHTEGYFDAFYFINPRPEDILSDYYELTGTPTLMPEYAFYEFHLNTFNRDYWVEVKSTEAGAILFEDGKYYKKYKPDEKKDKEGILESLNGEKNNYQFSARAMIDRYKKNNMPLGCLIPNDGYGSGYGQSDTFQGDLDNLKRFIEYAHEHGVEVGLWTESNLIPKDPEHPEKGERDLYREVGVGSVALKCDVAWIGSGYSFGLNAVETVRDVFIRSAKRSIRPFIIMVDGWAGTQRHAGIWSGDQTGGKWNYIRFHIPSYIGAGLSGISNVGSDMDGIYGGGVKIIQIRDFQWKTFTPIQLNMDGWGSTQKTPFGFDKETTTINRAYLKLKSAFMPYNYTINYESLHGVPMVRAMFLEFPKETPAYTKDSQYQFMWGPSVLVAPVYEQNISIQQSHVRNYVYLPDPDQIWIDLFTGKKYQGGKIYMNIETPLWKIPVYVKDGGIIPFVNSNNNPTEIKRNCRIIQIYPNGKSAFKIYEDDGKSLQYQAGHLSRSKVTVAGPLSNNSGDLVVQINKATGFYPNMIKERSTIVQIMASKVPQNIKVVINSQILKIDTAETKEEFEKLDNASFYDEKFVISPYLQEISATDIYQKFLLIKLKPLDVTETEIEIKVKEYCNKGEVFGSNQINNNLEPPTLFQEVIDKVTPTSITLTWAFTEDASYFEIERDGVVLSNILGTVFECTNLLSDTEYTFRIRVILQGVSQWSEKIFVKTKESRLSNVVLGVKVTCSVNSQANLDVSNLTNYDATDLWHTDWNQPWQADSHHSKCILLNFDLNNVYNIDNVDYIPREEGENGVVTHIQYRYSTDGENWSDLSETLQWKPDNTLKVIEVNAKFRYFEINILDALGGFGSGQHVMFHRKE